MTFVGPHPWDAVQARDAEQRRRQQSKWAEQLMDVRNRRYEASEKRRDADDDDDEADRLRDTLIVAVGFALGSPSLVEDLVELTGLPERDVRDALAGEHGL